MDSVFFVGAAENHVALRRACDKVGIDHAQLHGDGARQALKELPLRIKVRSGPSPGTYDFSHGTDERGCSCIFISLY